MTDAAPQTTTRDDLLDAAEACFERTGFAGTTMDDVAAEAGVNTATLLGDVSSRDELLVLVLLRVWQRESEALAALLDVQANTRAKLIEGVTFFVTRIAESPYLLELIRHEGATGWEQVDNSRLLVTTFGNFLRPYFVGHGAELRADIDDTIEWLMRQVLLLLTIKPHRGLTPAEIRYQVRTFIVPSVVRETPEV